MPKNVLIGIGGTGSRVIESVVHLCAAGLGPDQLNIFIIDPDEGNGNLTRTKSLIKRYTELRKLYQRAKKDNPAFRTEIIIPPGDEPFVWNIFEEKDYTLGKFINYDNLKKNDPSLANLANILFTEKELETSLNKGFRGHPSIGAVVMADPPMDEYPFKLLWDNIGSLHANDLRVFLVGSIFGGTGAAGFPTLGSRQLIKFNEKMQAKLTADKSKVLLGGALVLPYFSFSVDSNNTEPMFVTPNDFPIATKAALQYYNDKELGFDQYYFIGDSLAQKVGEFSTGSSTQDNLPHYVELVSALASFDFFGQPSIDDVPDKKFFISCREDDRISWDMIPITRNSSNLQEERKALKEKLADFTLFAYTFLSYGKSILEKSHKDVRAEAWYGDNFNKEFKEDNKMYNPRHEENNTLYQLADEYLNDFLFWACAMDANEKIQLVDKSKILNGELTHKGKLKLTDPQEFVANIGEILKDRSNRKDFYVFKKLGLEESVVDEESMTAGSRFLNIFYRASRKFNEVNLVIN
ncbi:hypothetical protein [Foetidibacter luteolus]|uniref:hypothetical protein n=1 Tax=Foetidibacter luteolus TaxID=2608880 RepID=UPI00129AC1AC|nr:hypothetical protein [Foetidibacter luteolus]